MTKNIERLEDFCMDRGELELICREMDCDGTRIVLTKKQADYKASIEPTFKMVMEVMNQEPTEICADPF